MNRYFFAALLFGILSFIPASAQENPRYYVNKQLIDSLGVEYITIHASQQFLSDKVRVELEYGQVNKSLASSETRISDVNGREVVFNSVLEVLNLLARQGYEYVDSFIDPFSNDGKTLKFLLRKLK